MYSFGAHTITGYPINALDRLWKNLANAIFPASSLLLPVPVDISYLQSYRMKFHSRSL